MPQDPEHDAPERHLKFAAQHIGNHKRHPPPSPHPARPTHLQTRTTLVLATAPNPRPAPHAELTNARSNAQTPQTRSESQTRPVLRTDNG